MLLITGSDLPSHHQEEEQQFLLLAYRNTSLLQSALDRSINHLEFKGAHLIKDSMNNEQVRSNSINCPYSFSPLYEAQIV